MESSVTDDADSGEGLWVYSHESIEDGWYITTHWFRPSHRSAEVMPCGIEVASYDASGGDPCWDRSTYQATFPGPARVITRSLFQDLPLGAVIAEHRKVVAKAMADEERDARQWGDAPWAEEIKRWRAAFAKERGNKELYRVVAEIYRSVPAGSRAPAKAVHRVLTEELGLTATPSQVRKWIQRAREAGHDTDPLPT